MLGLSATPTQPRAHAMGSASSMRPRRCARSGQGGILRTSSKRTFTPLVRREKQWDFQLDLEVVVCARI